MNKQQAIEAMKNGEKIKHSLFSNEEFITMKEDEIIDEKGYTLKDFWKYRTGQVWESNYWIYNK